MKTKTFPLCFFHGLDSSPGGTKARLLKKTYPECWIPELPPDIYKRIDIVEIGITAPAVVIGSSLGGLTAVMYAMAHPEMIRGMVLMAPAVGCTDKSILAEHQLIAESLYIPGGFQTVIIAGIHDTLIPISAIRSVIKRSPEQNSIRLHEVEDDHMLHDSLGLMFQEVEEVIK
jgi:predicted alpha/beta hydrolase family esterase